MGTKRTILTLEEDEPEYFLVGVSCHQKDYRFVWLLNNALNCDFRKEPDYEIVRKTGETISFLMYSWSEQDNHYRFYVINNHSESGTLIPEHKALDYLVLVSGKYEHLDTRNLIQSIKSIDSVLIAYEINPATTESCKNLIPE